MNKSVLLAVLVFPLLASAVGPSSQDACAADAKNIASKIENAQCIWDTSSEKPPVPDIPVGPNKLPWPGVKTYFQYVSGHLYCMGVMKCKIEGREYSFDRTICEMKTDEIPNATANLPNSCRGRAVSAYCKASKKKIELAQCANPKAPLPHGIDKDKIPMRLPANLAKPGPLPPLFPAPTKHILEKDKNKGSPDGT